MIVLDFVVTKIRPPDLLIVFGPMTMHLSVLTFEYFPNIPLSHGKVQTSDAPIVTWVIGVMSSGLEFGASSRMPGEILMIFCAFICF